MRFESIKYKQLDKNGFISHKKAFKDNRWHQFRLEINPDNTYEVSLDTRSVGKGSLLEDFNPPVNPPKEIDDPEDTKPEDWDEREKIPDPEAGKNMLNALYSMHYTFSFNCEKNCFSSIYSET